MAFGSGTEEQPDVSGTSYLLTADRIGSVGPGSPVLFRGIEVGQVISSTFDGADQGFTVRVFVQKPYDAFVHEHSQFWNASGISVSTEPGGFKVELESPQAALSGGVAFDTSEAARQGEPAKADTVFALYDDRAAAVEAGYTKRLRFVVEFEGSVRGLEIGAPVEAKGMKIGRVVDFHLVVDATENTVRVPVVCEIDLAPTNITNQSPDQAGKGILIADLVKRRPAGAATHLEPDHGTAVYRVGLLPRRAAGGDRRGRSLSAASHGADAVGEPQRDRPDADAGHSSALSTTGSFDDAGAAPARRHRAGIGIGQ
jgi:hypothetical protein